MPKLSIGLPVYNGEQYLSDAIDSVLTQSFHDFELIISDNGSNDNTELICRDYAVKDSRIRYYRSNKNFGATWNFNRVFELSVGKYFKWAAHDDMFLSDFFMNCVDLLDRDESFILCCSEVSLVDENGSILKKYDKILQNIDSREPHIRFADLIRIDYGCLEVFGIIRRNILNQTSLIGNYIGSDRNLLAELGLLGRFYCIPVCLFSARQHPERSIKISSPVSLTKWFDPKKKVRYVFPHWKNFYEYLISLHRIKLPLKQRVMCYFHLVKWLKINSWRLRKDLKTVTKEILPDRILDVYRFIKRFSSAK